MLIVPFWYLFRTLLVPKVAMGIVTHASSFVFLGRGTRFAAPNLVGERGGE